MSFTRPVDLRYSYGTFTFNTHRGSLGQRRRRLSRTDDQRTKDFDRFFIRKTSVRVIRLGVTEPLISKLVDKGVSDSTYSQVDI